MLKPNPNRVDMMMLTTIAITITTRTTITIAGPLRREEVDYDMIR